MKLTKIKAIMLIGALALSLPINVYAEENVSDQIHKTALHVQSSVLDSDWHIITLGRAGKLTASNKTAYLDKLDVRLTGDVKGTELHKIILALRALGENPQNYKGQNLIKKAYSDTTLTSTTAYIYALIALDSGDYDIPADALWTKQKLIDRITASDLPTGGWAGWDGTASVDSTGMALTALSAHKDDPVVKADIDNAVNFLKTSEGANAEFGDSFSGDNANSTSQAIIGLSSVGVDPTAGDFVKGSTNPVKALLSYKTQPWEDGFKWLKSETAENSMATEQAFQALVAYDLFKNGDRLFHFAAPLPVESTPALPSTPAPTPTVVNNNNYVTVTPTTDVSKLPVSESTKEVIREIITNNNAGTAGAAGNTSSQPQVIVVQQPAAVQTAAGEPKVEVKVEKESGTINSNNLKVGGTTAFIGALALILRRKFLGV